MKIGNPAEKPLAVVPTTSHGAGVDAAKAGAPTAAAAATPGTPDPSATVELSSTAAAQASITMTTASLTLSSSSAVIGRSPRVASAWRCWSTPPAKAR